MQCLVLMGNGLKLSETLNTKSHLTPHTRAVYHLKLTENRQWKRIDLPLNRGIIAAGKELKRRSV